MIQSYKASELARIEGKDARTIRSNHNKYIPIKVETYRAKQNKKGYTIRYIKKSDLF